MSIVTVDGALAGMQPPSSYLKVGSTMEAAGVAHSLFYTGGMPGAATAPSPGINGAALTSYSGQLPFSNPVTGTAYLARLTCNASQPGTLILCDRLWHNSSITSTTTTLQAITSGAMPARDRNQSTNGTDLRVALEVSSGTGNGSAITNCTITYTNSAGTAGRSGTMTSFPATAQSGTFVPFELANGDAGFRKFNGGSEGLTLGTSLVSGTVHLVVYREIARIDIPAANIGSAIDMLTSGFPVMAYNCVPFLVWIPSSTTGVTLSGQIVYSHG